MGKLSRPQRLFRDCLQRLSTTTQGPQSCTNSGHASGQWTAWSAGRVRSPFRRRRCGCYPPLPPPARTAAPITAARVRVHVAVRRATLKGERQRTLVFCCRRMIWRNNDTPTPPHLPMRVHPSVIPHPSAFAFAPATRPHVRLCEEQRTGSDTHPSSTTRAG
jgi:hypothetical protein